MSALRDIMPQTEAQAGDAADVGEGDESGDESEVKRMEEKQPEQEEAAETPNDSDFWAAPAWAGNSLIDGAVSLIQTVDKEIAQSSPEEQKQMRHALKAMTKMWTDGNKDSEQKDSQAQTESDEGSESD